jgi:tRNA pseudouridine38-40 synthase
MRYFFRVEYDGANYGGWQRQKNAVSVQQCLEEAFSTVAGHDCAVVGAGRTDAGVHARGQGAHVDIDRGITANKVEISVNGLLPPDIAIYGLTAVDERFHARYSARHRTYAYYLTTRKRPLVRCRAWSVRYRIDWEAVERAVEQHRGTHDFVAFCSTNTTTENMRCTVHRAALDRSVDPFVFTICADRYVYKMVRSLVGTLVDIGRGAIEFTIGTLLERRDRSLVGQTAPPWGLVLEHVVYPGGL